MNYKKILIILLIPAILLLTILISGYVYTKTNSLQICAPISLSRILLPFTEKNIFLSPIGTEDIPDLEKLRELEKNNQNFKIIGIGTESIKEELKNKAGQLNSERIKYLEENPERFRNAAVIEIIDGEEATRNIVLFDKCKFRLLWEIIPFCYDDGGSCNFWAGGWPWYANCKGNPIIPFDCLCTASW